MVTKKKDPCACGEYGLISVGGGVGGVDALGRAESHSASECRRHDPTRLIARVLWAVGQFFSGLALDTPKKTPRVTILASRP